MTVKKRAKVGKDTLGREAVSELLHVVKARLDNLPKLTGLTVFCRSLSLSHCQVEQVREWSEKSGVCVPFVRFPIKNTPEYEHLRFGSDKPGNISIVGSFLVETMISLANIDVALEMPKEILKERDEVSYRYLFKRAFYLATVAEALQGMNEFKGAEFRWIPFRGHVLKPTLEVRPSGMELVLKFHVTLPEGVIGANRLIPSRNSVRPSAFLALEDEMRADVGNFKDTPTPTYNSLVLVDMLMVPHLKLLHNECKRIPALKDAIKLGKAWIHQRYSSYLFHLTGYQFTMFALFLCKTGTIQPTMGDLQIFKAILSFLTEVDWHKGLFFSNTERDDEMYKSFAATLVEPVVGMNVLFDWTAQTADEVKRDARHALNVLNDDGADYNALFLHSDPQLAKFDTYYLVKDFDWMPKMAADPRGYLDQFFPEKERFVRLAHLLKLCLNTRIAGLAVHAHANQIPAGIKKYDAESMRTNQIGVGLFFDRAECLRIVELGPAADDKDEAAKFRGIWKQRAELRRFQDGSIREAVAWDHLKDDRHQVVPNIVQFVLKEHFGHDKDIGLTDLALDFAWVANTTFRQVQDAILKFTRNMRNMDLTPLKIARCEPINDVGRLTSLTPPKPITGADLYRNKDTLPEYRSTVDCLVYLEGSNRWPDDYYGMLYAKQAFAVQICRQLRDEYGLATSMTSEYFNVFADGLVFRCWIHQGEQVKLMKAHGIDASEYITLFEEMPRHARAISALAQGDVYYAPVVRLLKSWIASQMYSLQVTDDMVELLVACVFLKSTPSSVMAGFVRVLNLIVKHPWTDAPLLVDFEKGESNRWSPEKAHAVFEDSISPRLPVWIAPSYLPSAGCLMRSSRNSLTTNDLENIQKLAKAALGMICTNEQDLKVLFRPSPSRFDLFLHLVDFREHGLPAIKKLLNSTQGEDFLRALPGFEPVDCLLADLTVALPNGNFYKGDGIIGVRISEGDTAKTRDKIMSIASGMVLDIEVRR
jgi:U3 small nucleolar RNA-associated protein 22